MSSTGNSRLQVDLQAGKPPLLRVEPPDDVALWAAEHRDALRAVIDEHGSLLIRGLGLSDAMGAEAVFRQLGRPIPEREGFAARRRLGPEVYSSSTWPSHLPMCMHHELSYAREVPSFIMFACLVAPTDGGATPLADATTVLRALPAKLIQRFDEVGWLLIRNYIDGIGASVEAAFGTDDRSAIESYCRANTIDFEWQAEGTLRTWQRRRAILAHPRTGRRCWFNQVAFLSEWTLEPEVREYLVDIYDEEGLPFNTRFGDGRPIGANIVQAINQTYEAHTLREPWQAGDLLLVDNIRTAHGRESFQGLREVLVAMADRSV